MSLEPNAAAVSAEQPWPGLMPFTEEASAFFHGRGAETAELVRLIKRETLTVLFGQSGLGKSSLLNAGVFPQLRSEDFLPVYIRLDVSAQAAPLAEQVKQAIRSQCEKHGVEAPAPRADEPLWAYFHRKDADFWSARNRLLTPVLVLDQFEEIFTLGRHLEELEARCRVFLAELADLVEDRASAAVTRRIEQDPAYCETLDFSRRTYKVVLSFREDYLPEFEGLREQIRSIMQNRMRLTRMNGQQARDVVLKPGARIVSEAVADQIIRFVAAPRASGTASDDLSRLEVEPALLSVVCRELNNQRIRARRREITADMLQAGAQQQIIREFYETSLAGVDVRVREFVEDQLLTDTGYRDSYAYDDALALPGVTREAIDVLIGRRLLRLEERSGILRVELTHDLLTRVAKESRDQRQSREAERRSRELDAARRDRVRKFAAAGAVAIVAAVGLAVVFAVLLERANRDKQRLVETQSYVLLGQASAGLDQNVPGEPQVNLAQALRLYPANDGAAARAVSWLTQRAHAKHLWTASSIASDARVRFYDRELIAVAGAAGVELRLGASGRRWLQVAASGDDHEDFGLISLHWSAQAGAPHAYQDRSRSVAYVSSQRVLHLFDVDTLKPIGRRLQLADTPRAIEVSPGRRWVALSFPGGGLRVAHLGEGRGYEVTPERAPRAPVAELTIEAVTDGGAVAVRNARSELSLYLPESDGKFRSFALGRFDGPVRASPDGAVLAAARRAELVLFSVAKGAAQGKPLAHPMVITDLDFDGAGRMLATASLDRFARIWDVWSVALAGPPLRHDGAVLSVRFSADSSALATGSTDGTARVWDPYTGTLLSEPVMQSEPVQDARFSPDGERILTFTRGGRLSLWQLPRRAADAPAVALGAPTTAFAMSADETLIALGGENGDFGVWRMKAATPEERWRASGGSSGAVVGLRYSGDGRRLAVAFADGSLEVREAADGRAVGRRLRHARRVLAMEFSADGSMLATGSADRTARIWRLGAQALASLPMRHDGAVSTVSFSPDGKVLMTGGEQGLGFWDAETGVSMGPSVLETTRITAAAWSTDGKIIVAATDNAVYRCRINPSPSEDAKSLKRYYALDEALLRLSFPIWSATFDARRELLIVGGLDGSARIVKLDTLQPEPVGEVMRHNATVLGATISRDGRWIVTRAADRSVRVWDAKSGHPVSDASFSVSDVVGALLTGGGDSLLAVRAAGGAQAERISLGFPSPAPGWLRAVIEAAGGLQSDRERGTSPVLGRERNLRAMKSALSNPDAASGRAAAFLVHFKAEGSERIEPGWWTDWANAILPRLVETAAEPQPKGEK